MSVDRDAMIYQDTDGDIILVLYIKLSASKLKQALPLGYDPTKLDHNYLIVWFKQGMDYIGQSSWEEINKTIDERNMLSLLSCGYDTLHELYSDLSQDTHAELLALATKQLAIDC
jgi:hypothetical protein